MRKIPEKKIKQQRSTPKKTRAAKSDDALSHLAFDNSLQANIISTVSSGKIIMANTAACKLLGYAKKELLTKNSAAIFDINERSFKIMLRHTRAKGQAIALVTAIHKKGKLIPCEISSGIFKGDNGIEKAIITIADMSQNILKQKNIDTKKEKIVADNITLAREKSDARLKKEIRLKEIQIAAATEDARDMARSDIGKELHDNVNQLLGASRMYLELAQRGGGDWEMFLSRSSEYILTAIEEIRKLTKGLTSDFIKNLGLCESIYNLSRDTMEANPVKISCSLEHFKEHSVHYKFKLDVYRIVQEQLNNILKHAKATEVTISFLQDRRSMVLSITDNGVGFDTSKKRKGIGIENIKSRAAVYNGIADFVSQPGKGCVLTATFPVKDKLLNK